MRSSVRTVLVALISVLLIALFLRNANLAQVWNEFQRSRWDLVGVSLLALVVTYIVRAVRWQYLLTPLGSVHFTTVLRTTVIGFGASALLPARAGEVLRPYLLARKEGLSATAAFATILLERVLDTVMVLLLFGVFLLFADTRISGGDPESFSRLQAGGLVVGAVCVVALAVMASLAGRPAVLTGFERMLADRLPPRFGGKVGHLVHAFADGLAIVRQPTRLAWAVALSLPVWLSIAVSIWAVTRAFHIDMPLLGSFLMMALLVIGVAVPTPGAVGGFHYFYRLGAVSFFGASSDRAVGAAIVLHAVSFVPVAIVGLILLAQDGLSLTSVERMARARSSGEAA